MAARKLFGRKNTASDKRPDKNAEVRPTGESVSAAPEYQYCSFCGQKYAAGTKHYCSVNDLIKYDLR